MKKFVYTIETLSSLILSPRSGQAFYKDVDSFCVVPKIQSTDLESQREAHIVYPFYQYGEYEEYDPEYADYYIPGSSIKGALQLAVGLQNRIMVDDVPVSNNYIVLRNLWKAQFLKEKKEAKMAAFFENVGVEMVKKGAALKGELYIDEHLEVSNVIEQANKGTKIKIQQMCDYIQAILGYHFGKTDFEKVLRETDEKLQDLLNEQDIILLGGYKGLLHSIQLVQGENMAEVQSGIFIDRECGLPHGIIKMKIC